MAITRWDPWREFGTLQERINRIFDGTMGGVSPGERENMERGTWVPAVDIHETEDSYGVKVDLPGVKREDIHIDLKDSTLTLKGEKKFEEKVSRDNYLRVERAYGTFVRSFTLPHDIDVEKINAKYKDGVLELILPKKEEAKPKQIKVDIE